MMGVLPIKEGTRLGILLCNLLQCTSARLSSKLKTGKVGVSDGRGLRGLRPVLIPVALGVDLQKCFKYTLRPTPGELTKCDRLQRELSEKEELFLYYLSPEDAAAISQRLQMEWRAHFMHVAQRVGQQIDNLDSWSSLLKEHVQMEGLGRSGSFTSENSDLQQQLPGGGTPQQQGQLRGLASMLVRMASDKRNQYAPRHMSGSTTFDDLLEHLSAGPREELALLARAHHGSILFASAGLKVCLDLEDGDILGAWLNRPGGGSAGRAYGWWRGAADLTRTFVRRSFAGLLHPDDVPLLEQICRQSQVDVRGLMDRMGNPQVRTRTSTWLSPGGHSVGSSSRAHRCSVVVAGTDRCNRRGRDPADGAASAEEEGRGVPGAPADGGVHGGLPPAPRHRAHGAAAGGAHAVAGAQDAQVVVGAGAGGRGRGAPPG